MEKRSKDMIVKKIPLAQHYKEVKLFYYLLRFVSEYTKLSRKFR
jgi:hypothetical protein